MLYAEKEAEIARFFAWTRRAFIASIGLTVVLLVIFGLVAMRVGLSTCATLDFKEGYRALDFFGLSIAGAFLGVMFGRVLLDPDKTRRSLKQSTVSPLFGVRFPPAASSALANQVLVGVLIMGGLILGIAVTHYWSLLTDCMAVALPR